MVITALEVAIGTVEGFSPSTCPTHAHGAGPEVARFILCDPWSHS